MNESTIVLRAPRADEAETLSALMLRAKAYWGYSEDFMAACVPVLTLAPSCMENPMLKVAADADGDALGVLLVSVDGEEACLDKLFVDPDAMGRGVGAMLFEEGVRLARAAGCREMAIESDPGAEPFYLHMGAVRVGEAPSEAIPGRMLPLLSYSL